MQETWVRSLNWEDPLEKEMATHSSILAWEIPWEDPIIPWGHKRVRYDLATKQKNVKGHLTYVSNVTSGKIFIRYSIALLFGESNGNPLQYSCLENPMDGGAWQATVHGVTRSRTWLSDFTFTFHFHALEEEMATHSSVLACRIPPTGEPGGLLSMGSHRVGHDWSDLAAALLLLFGH